VLFVFLKLC